MPLDPYLMLFVLCLLMLILMVASAILLSRLFLNLLKLERENSQKLLTVERKNNQRLQNFLTARDLQTLAGLNHATGVSESSTEPMQVTDLDLSDLGESINYEEELAKQGYQLGDLDGLEAYGWSSTPTRRGDGDPIAFDS